jgi:hypothetical protein
MSDEPPKTSNSWTGNGNRTWKEAAWAWLEKQGVPTVLLFAILAAIVYFVPQHLAVIQAGYDRLQGEFKGVLVEQRTDFLKQQTEQRQDFTETLRAQRMDNREAIEEMTTRIERAIDRSGT